MTRKHQTGFTLVEIAIVLAILGIVLGGLFAGTSALRETAKFKEDQQKLQDIKAALLSYVAVNNYLPCPDTTGDGIENPSDFSQPQCDATAGTLPFISLGTHSVNAYGLPFSYYINSNATNANSTTDPASSASYFGRTDCDADTSNETNAPCFNQNTPPAKSIAGTGNFNISNGSSNIAADVPLVVISHGQNGCTNVGGREEDNCTNNATTYYQVQQNREGANQFDDVLIWLSSLEIKAVTADILSYNSLGNNNGSEEDDNFVPIQSPPNSSDVEFDQIVSGDFNDSGQVSTTQQGDKIKIEGDMNQYLNLENGEDYLYVEGNLNAQLDAGNQDKTVFIDGDLNQEVDLGNGDNMIEVTGNVNAPLFSGNGIDKAIIYGSVNALINLRTSGNSNEIYIGGDINNAIIAKGTAYINKSPAGLPNWQYDNLSGFSSILCRQTAGSLTWVNCR